MLTLSPLLMKFGLKRGHLLEEETDRAVTMNTTQPIHPATHEETVDLENFRVREKLKDKFTSQWIRTLSGSTEADQVLESNIKQMMTCYCPLRTKKVWNVSKHLCSSAHEQTRAVCEVAVHPAADCHEGSLQSQ